MYFKKIMQSKILSKRVLLIIVLGLVLFVVLFLYFVPKNLIWGNSALLAENVVVLSTEGQFSVGLPVRLEIPVIGVDATIIPTGLTLDGAMDVPKDLDEVAWLNLGLRPGEDGSAVIAGHYGWKNNRPAVFDNLYKLRQGDEIFIEDERGVITAFVVREIRTYDKDEAVSGVFRSDDDKAHLNLITCTGVWDEVEKTYSGRLIVLTDKE